MSRTSSLHSSTDSQTTHIAPTQGESPTPSNCLTSSLKKSHWLFRYGVHTLYCRVAVVRVCNNGVSMVVQVLVELSQCPQLHINNFSMVVQSSVISLTELP